MRVVPKIDGDAIAPEGVGTFDVTTAGSHNAVNGLAQRRVMDRAGLIERQIGGTLLRGKPLRQQVGKHHHISLLKDLHVVDFRAGIIEQNGLLTRFGFVAAEINGRFDHEGIILRDHTV